jgi:zinc transporter ZupT
MFVALRTLASHTTSSLVYCESSIISAAHSETHLPPLLLTIPVVSTLAGGLLALRLRSSLKLLIALSVGLLLGAAFLDLLPEAIALQTDAGGSVAGICGLTLLSFLFFVFVQSLLDGWIEHIDAGAAHRTWGRIGGSLLIAHSFRDGMAIGLSYAASHPAGYVVAIGIAAHDIGDGVNTVLLSTRGERAGRIDYLFLAADALAPLAGGLLTIWFHLSAQGSAMLLAIAAGFFLHMVASELLPQLRGERSLRLNFAFAIFAGALLIYLATKLIT